MYGFLVLHDCSVEKRVSGHLICSLVRDRLRPPMGFALGTLAPTPGAARHAKLETFPSRTSGIQVQNAAGFLSKIGIAGKNPAAVIPPMRRRTRTLYPGVRLGFGPHLVGR